MLFDPFCAVCFCDAIWGNDPTRNKFRNLWNALKVIDSVKREEIYHEYNEKQLVQHFYEDRNYNLPNIPDDIAKLIGCLCKHLFERSSKLSAIEQSCGETLQDHFDSFCSSNNNICCFCGTSELSQGIGRAANDHLLPKKLYPMFAVHPENLVPLCETCNSKAKLAKDLLFKDSGVRRLCLFPFMESCSEFVGVDIKAADLGLRVSMSIFTTAPNTLEKISTWNSVYQIEERVGNKFAQLINIIDSDCPAHSLNDLKSKIRDKAISCKEYCRLESWNFWKYRLYEWLDESDDVIIEEIWNNLIESRSDNDAAAIYGI